MGRAKKSVGACHIAEVKRVYKDTTYTTTLLRSNPSATGVFRLG